VGTAISSDENGVGSVVTVTAVNLAARVEQACDDGAIFVSSTVCDLMMGSDATFDDRGQHTLKGFDRPWRLFSLASHH
jgi:class 3 adenylate cyclase